MVSIPKIWRQNLFFFVSLLFFIVNLSFTKRQCFCRGEDINHEIHSALLEIQAEDSRPRGHIEHTPKYDNTVRPTNENIEIISNCKIPTFFDFGVTGPRSPFLKSIFNLGSLINHVTIRPPGGVSRKVTVTLYGG